MYTVQGCRELKLLLDHVRLEAGYNLDSLLVYLRANTYYTHVETDNHLHLHLYGQLMSRKQHANYTQKGLRKYLLPFAVSHVM